MQYELYIDLFFLVNFVLDFLILRIVDRILKCTATHGRILIGAFSGAGISCAIICAPLAGMWKQIILHILVNSIMIKITFRTKKNTFFKTWLLLYLTGFMMGGVLEFIKQYMGKHFKTTVFFIFVVVCSYEVVLKIMDFLETYWKMTGHKCKVSLFFG